VIPFDSLILQLLLTFPSAGLALPQHGEIVRYAILNQNGSREENNINSYLVKAREAANKFTILNLLQANTACELLIQSWLITLVTFLLNNQSSTKTQTTAYYCLRVMWFQVSMDLIGYKPPQNAHCSLILPSGKNPFQG
jgi:hypothetical protein